MFACLFLCFHLNYKSITTTTVEHILFNKTQCELGRPLYQKDRHTNIRRTPPASIDWARLGWMWWRQRGWLPPAPTRLFFFVVDIFMPTSNVDVTVAFGRLLATQLNKIIKKLEKEQVVENSENCKKKRK